MFSTTRIFCGNIIRHYRYPLGIVAAIPILATAQGAYCLTRFRWNHKNAPYPMSPSRGIVIVSPHDAGSNDGICMDNAQDKNMVLVEERRPWWLWNRRQKTKENEKQIPLSLLVIGDSLAAGVGSRLGTPVLPEAIARSLSKALGGRPVFWTCHGTPGAATAQIMRDVKEMSQKRMTVEIFNKKVQESKVFNVARGKFRRWIENITGDFRKEKLIANKNTKEGTSMEESGLNCEKAVESAGPYDIIIVLTGINDLKGIFLPFLQDTTGTNNQGFKEELRLLLKVLRENLMLRMTKLESSNVTTLVEAETSFNEDKGSSLVVIPAIPIITPLLRYPPLGFLLPHLCSLLDEQKRALAMECPRDILFVEAPTLEMVTDFEKGHSVFISKRKAEELLLNFKDVTLQVRDKIENLMSKHIERHEIKGVDKETELLYEASRNSNMVYNGEDPVGSKLVSIDGVHPNDDGYEFWGRYIADEIIRKKIVKGCYQKS